jgi:hypothetical protein
MPNLSQFSPYLDVVLAHLPLSLLIAAVVFTVLLLLVMRRFQPFGSVLEVFFRSYLFWTLTLLFVRDAVTLGAFGPDAAAVLGPVGTADMQAANLSLAFAVVSFLALSGSFGLRLAAVIGVAVSILAPFASAVPTTDLVLAHLPEVGVVAVGVLLILLQWTGSLGRSARRHETAVA